MPSEKNIALAYQQAAVRGANSTAITGMIFDVGIESLHRAIRAIDEGKVEERIKATNKFFEVVAELRSALDYERGGKLAQRLGRFYQLARNQIFSASIRVDRPEFEKYANLFTEIREAWRRVEEDHAGAPAAPEKPPLRTVTAAPAEPAPPPSSWRA